MKRLLIVLSLTMATAAHADEETARKRAHTFKQAYWDCLTAVTVQALPRKLSGQDFSYYIKGSCPDEAQPFREAMMGYLGLKFPGIDIGAHLASANMAISAAQDDVVKAYIEHNR